MGVMKLETGKIKNAGTIGWLQQSIHRGRNEVFSEVKTVTPELAEVMLTNNPDNRRVRAVKRSQMVSDMRGDRWTFNGEPIIVAKTGELNDGQHRLEAIVESKVCVPMLFVFGLERETRTTIDQGVNRSPGDYLHMGGTPNATTQAAIARMLLGYERAERKSLGRTNDVTAAQILERVAQDKTLATSTQYGQRHGARMKRYASASVLGFCHNVLLSSDINDGLAFMEMLCLGENIQRGDPAFTARERLLGMEDRKTPSRVEVIIRAWNAYRERRTLRTIPIHGRLPEVA